MEYPTIARNNCILRHERMRDRYTPSRLYYGKECESNKDEYDETSKVIDSYIEN